MAHHFFHYYSQRCRRMVSELPGVIGPSIDLCWITTSLQNGSSTIRHIRHTDPWHLSAIYTRIEASHSPRALIPQECEPKIYVLAIDFILDYSNVRKPSSSNHVRKPSMNESKSSGFLWHFSKDQLMIDCVGLAFRLLLRSKRCMEVSVFSSCSFSTSPTRDHEGD